MGDSLKELDAVALSDDLIGCLMDGKDANLLNQNLEHWKLLHSQSDADYSDVHKLLQEYQRKIDLSKKKAEEAKSEVAGAEMDFLQKELEEELQRESLLREELRVVTDEISDLEQQRVSLEEKMLLLKKLKQDDLKEQMKLAMYASVTKIIPDLDEDSKISGYIVEKEKEEKEEVEDFEFDPSVATSFDTCNSIWEMISLR